ncbi:hypothetical protein Tco_0839677 [Tanacetum coccineum]|uniref:MAK10-like protein n=1 Tax=Tanacetum coccineum TaxID=301880 RepID=A0ABQ5ARB3_9ASTR
MGDENPRRTLGDYSRPSHEGYQNTIEVPHQNDLAPLRFDTICGPHDTQYCMEDPEQAFVEYASTRTDEAGNKGYTFKPEENNLGDTYNPSWKSHPNLRFEVDFKQYQSEVTNKLDTFLKAFNDQMMGLLLSDTVKNPKLNTMTLFARSHLAGDPQSSSNSFKSVNAIQTCFISNTHDKNDQLQVNTLKVSENETPTLLIPLE